MTLNQVTTVGDWQSEADSRGELQIAIHDGWARRWSYAGRLADYVSAYFRADLSSVGSDQSAEAAAFLNYAVNEMIENAVKFGRGQEIELRAKLLREHLQVTVTSRAEPEAAQRYRQVVQEIAAGDPLMLLMERVERNAIEGPSAGSGLGLLSIMTDYGASLGWRFQPVQEASVSISTMARMPINLVGTE